MPRIIDADQRRADVFDAVFRVIAADGIAAATLAKVADSAGLAIGSVRHFLGSHQEMLTAAAEEVRRRIGDRLELHVEPLLTAAGRGQEVRDLILDMLAELLPLDDVRQRETAVWLEFVMAARTRPGYEESARAMFSGLRTLTDRIADRLGLAAPAGERLAAVVDGLALVGTLHPELQSPQQLRGTLAAELDALLGSAAGR